jgi:hypothetical protein
MSTESRGGAADQLDARDEELLGLLRECHEAMDPMPGSLVERSLFALALQDLDAEVFRLAESYELEPAGARGEEARVVTFDSDSLTVMIRIHPQDRVVRIDGWLAPPQPCRVELRTGGRVLSTGADEEGRFVLDQVPRGLAQLVVRRGEPMTGGSEQSILTPAIVL